MFSRLCVSSITPLCGYWRYESGRKPIEAGGAQPLVSRMGMESCVVQANLTYGDSVEVCTATSLAAKHALSFLNVQCVSLKTSVITDDQLCCKPIWTPSSHNEQSISSLPKKCPSAATQHDAETWLSPRLHMPLGACLTCTCSWPEVNLTTIKTTC